MSRIARLCVAIMACSLMITGFVGVSPSIAAVGNPSYCDNNTTKIDNQSFGKKVPVILIHGFNGHSADWGNIQKNTGFVHALNNTPDAAVAHSFGYSSGFWVDYTDNGPMLAKVIDCVAQISQRSGGRGKVIIVGYSMGGLVARDALSRRSTDNARAIADEVGQVITIGTPHIGTTLPLAGGIVPRTLLAAFTPGSAELARLPHFPTQTIVHTIAGDVIRTYHDKMGVVVKREEPYDDTLVSTISANAEYTIDVTKGGGDHVIKCEKSYRARGFSLGYTSDKSSASCEHTQLISNPNNGVREDTIGAIGRYINSLSTTSLTIGSLTTYFDSHWSHVTYGAFGPGSDGWGDDMTSGVPCTNCTTEPNPTVYASAHIYYYRPQCSSAALQCALLYEQIVGSAPNVTIGGRTPDSSARYLDSGYLGTSLVWCFSDQGLCVYYRRAADAPQLELSQALLDLFRNATWSQ